MWLGRGVRSEGAPYDKNARSDVQRGDRGWGAVSVEVIQATGVKPEKDSVQKLPEACSVLYYETLARLPACSGITAPHTHPRRSAARLERHAHTHTCSPSPRTHRAACQGIHSISGWTTAKCFAQTREARMTRKGGLGCLILLVT